MLRFTIAVLLLLTVPGTLAQTEPGRDTAPARATAQADPAAKPQPTTEPLYTPFIERYILDELKMIRQDQQAMRAEMVDRVAQARLDASDRAVRYTTDTLNNVFFIITAAASIMVIVGWNSLRDIKSKLEEIVASRIAGITEEYEARLEELETRLKKRSEQIIKTQEEISKTNEMHSLWMRAGLENNVKAKIDVYDQILKINPNDVEAITYKADAILESGDSEWALNLSNRAIDLAPDYGHAYWQRACAEAELGQLNDAFRDIRLALEKSAKLSSEISKEPSFENLRKEPEYHELMTEYGKEA